MRPHVQERGFGVWFSDMTGHFYRLVMLTDDPNPLPHVLEWGSYDPLYDEFVPIEGWRYDDSAMAEHEGMLGLREWAMAMMPSDAKHVLRSEAVGHLVRALRELEAAADCEPEFLALSSLTREVHAVMTSHGVDLPQALRG